MLFITRHVGEKIVLKNADSGEKIADIIVKEIVSGQVNLGVHAPLSVTITRDSIKGRNLTKGKNHE
ncbi:MAG TPA: carbon storage regulator [Phycisphaerales bacterium]|nr:carbon storage regulator [Phycisphaerales bacterium]